MVDFWNIAVSVFIQTPSLLVYGYGMIVARRRWHQYPGPAHLVFFASLLLFVTVFGNLILWTLVRALDLFVDNLLLASRAISFLANFSHGVAILALIVAVFHQRRPAKPTPEESDYEECPHVK